ncbi:ABC transporter permease [Asticcacaulis sp. BYS171W]|uniref:ABC transporter permease n=1 Tax=Asticcacaulis aquaticus TaxID=2984212 RepID=A0ABT5HVD4_9CAUL|nr:MULTISPECIES: ABC transporter permease [Asticcacaulis]ESQ80138.1 permease [Asticcacaulis sp. YBE204]MDC7684030.1 ABC transporter permease [Asticcacaulis aquaticus]
MSLALSTLIYEWRRYMAAVIALAVAGLLVLALVGMFMGIGKNFSATIDRSPAHIMILPPDSEGLGTSQPRRNIPLLFQHSEVVEATPFNVTWGQFTNFPEGEQKAVREGVQIYVVDPIPGAVTLPTDFPEDVILALQEPYSVILDVTSLNKLGVKVGDKAKINGRTVTVRATISGYPSLFNSMIFTSRQSAKLLGLVREGPRVGAILVKVSDPARTDTVAAELNVIGKGQFKAWTKPELSKRNQESMFKNSFISILLGFMLVVGVFIGVVITWQTLQGAILANIKEFASLRALGVSIGSLNLIIMELSFWVGVAGLGMTAILLVGVTALAGAMGLTMFYPLWSVITIAIMLLIISVLSGLLSLGVLKKSQPADLLR